MDISFSPSVSGLQVSSLRHDVSANNVANINTNGFSASRLIQTDVVPQGVRAASIDKIPNPDPTNSGTDLAEETVAQIVNRDTFSANAQMIKAKDRMLGTLLDMMG